MLLDFLNEYYQADLEVIHDEADNKHLIGKSKVFDSDLFVKIFKDKDKFYAERNVNQVYCPDIYLDNVIYEENYVIILRDRNMLEVTKEELTPDMAYEFGQMLAKFHKKVTGQVLVPNDKRTLSVRVKEKLARFKDTAYEENVLKIYDLLKSEEKAADTDYALLPKVVLHGDFSLRNLMIYNENNVLIDFERAHVGVSYEDLIKFFFNEVIDLKDGNAFISGYRSQNELEIPNQSLQKYLLFLCALDILDFHLTHKKQKFGQMADAMFETIKRDEAILKL